VKLLLLDSLSTAPIVYPFQAGWIETDMEWELRPAISAAVLDENTAALIPSAEVALLHETHSVVPEVAVVAESSGTIAMRVPVRPDEVGRTVVRLYDVSGTAEILARATVEPFYGIVPSGWSREESLEAQVVIVDEAESLRAPEAGFSEDLVRAWFILTGQPLVSQLLIVPKSTDPAQVRDVMVEAVRIGHERRRDLRKAIAERFGVDRERLTELAATTRYALEEADRRALMTLLQRGNKGSTYPYIWQLTYAGDPAGEAA
jgi:predicted solute-binding protein